MKYTHFAALVNLALLGANDKEVLTNLVEVEAATPRQTRQ
tara:strand:- start:230 stop:349 length:120 start_codon:yes stop_codon:yes gene_type:complete